MAGSTFKTNPYDLYELLKDCHTGKLQLPDFQRSWVWAGLFNAMKQRAF